MALSPRQLIFAEYLLRRLGYVDKELMLEYLKKSEDVNGRYLHIQNEKTGNNGYIFYFSYYKFDNSGCIEELLNEINIRKHPNKINQKKIQKNIISATDLASFNFCPISFSISNSFEIEYPSNDEKRNHGINFHENMRLISSKEINNYGYERHIAINNPTINKIRSCKCLFIGHQGDKVNFTNSDSNFIGQPDYLFQDPSGKYFVVEEKFRYLNSYISADDMNNPELYEKFEKRQSKIKKVFYENHIIQLSAYIEYIKEYKIDYGILIYWFYDLNNGIPLIHEVSHKIIYRKEHKELLDRTKIELENFISTGEMKLENKLNQKKCAACVVNKYCAHKNGQIEHLSFPYKTEDLKLSLIEFPSELKKDNNSQK
jgi:hypothetical protein